ncbi:MAG: nicotinamide-nucleotide adenylyltransferase [Nanoarchaeota archaeon]|nr:nicotinamide-nucleotide adenylyltransferase [Nanoarchaeota archaeon]
MKRALFLGRFQPFHNGHLWAVKQTLKEFDEVIIVIGSAQQSNTEDNPLDAKARESMIRQSLKEAGISSFSIHPVDDINSDDEYVSHVESFVPKFDAVFTGNQLTEELFGKGYDIRKLKKYRNLSATKLREMLEQGKDISEHVPPAVARALSSRSR